MDVTIGNLDEDFYAGIAVASGITLTITGERGQAYLWDLITEQQQLSVFDTGESAGVKFGEIQGGFAH